MKILWVGDLHCQLRNIEEYGPMLQKLSGLASGCNYVVLAGDLLHGHSIIRTEPLNMVTNIVTTLARITNVIVLVGNHDYINASQYCTDAHPFNAFKSIPGITVVDKPVVIDNMVFAPYVPPGRLVEALNEFAPEWAACKVVFAHQEILGAHEGHFVSEKGDKWDKSFPPLISAHIHTRQRFDNVYYPGTPMQYTFGDDANKQVSVFTIDNKNGITGNDFQLGLKTYKTFCLQVEDMDEFNCPENCYVRVQVLGDVSQLTAFKKSKKYKELVSLGVKIIPVPNEMKLQVEHTNKVTYLELLRQRVSLENQEVQMLFNELFSEAMQ